MINTTLTLNRIDDHLDNYFTAEYYSAWLMRRSLKNYDEGLNFIVFEELQALTQVWWINRYLIVQ